MRKSFIVYPGTKIEMTDPTIQIADAPLKDKLKSFVTGYHEDYLELPSVEYLQSIFNISKSDAHMAITLYGGL